MRPLGAQDRERAEAPSTRSSSLDCDLTLSPLGETFGSEGDVVVEVAAAEITAAATRGRAAAEITSEIITAIPASPAAAAATEEDDIRRDDIGRPALIAVPILPLTVLDASLDEDALAL